LVRDNSETFTAAEATVKKKKKPVIQETSYQISAWKKSVSGMLEETSYTCLETSYQISVGAEEKKQITDLQETSYQISVRGRKRKQNTEVQEHKQISASTVRYLYVGLVSLQITGGDLLRAARDHHYYAGSHERNRRIARAKSIGEREISRRIARGVLTRGQLLSGQLQLL